MDTSDLKTYLECPVCLRLPRGKIFICINSHKICQVCLNRLPGVGAAKKCPSGGCLFDDPPRRGRDVEAIIENSRFELNCSKPGCNVEKNKDEIKVHELECIYRTVPCPHYKCQAEVVFKEIDSHIAQEHKDAIFTYFPISKPKVTDTILNSDDDMNWVLHSYAKDESQFYLQFVKRNSLWFAWVTIKDGPEAASRWVFTAKAKNDVKKVSVEYKGFVNPIDMKLEKVIETGQYLVLNRGSVEKLKKQSQVQIEIVFEISCSALTTQQSDTSSGCTSFSPLFSSEKKFLDKVIAGLSACLEIKKEDMNEDHDVLKLAPVFISKWVDYSNKFGFGFQMSDGSVGVMFNDKTKIGFSAASDQVEFTDLNGKTFSFSANQQPFPVLSERVDILKYYIEYMKENLPDTILPGMETIRTGHKTKMPQLSMWCKQGNYVAMELSNNMVQINHSSDNVKVVIWVLEGIMLVTLISPRTSQTFSLARTCPLGIRSRLEDTLREVRELCRKRDNV